MEIILEKCLTTSDLSNLDTRVFAANEDVAKYFRLATAVVVGGTEQILRVEDEEGKRWQFGFSDLNVSQRYVLTKGWSNYVKEKQLGVGDLVFFQSFYTDSSRLLLIGFRRSQAALGQCLDLTSLATSSEQLKEVEILPQLRSHGHRVTELNPVLVISCGENQDSEERYFISYISKELCLRGFTPLIYDLTRSTLTAGLEMLHSSRVGVIIFSKNYVCSRQCQDEFVAIMDHPKANNLVLLPVFFKVEVTDIRGQRGSFGRAFSRLEYSVLASQVPYLTSINKYQYMKGDEVLVVKNIVRDVFFLLNPEPNMSVRGRLQMKSILSLLNCSQFSAPHIVGLWGMAGIGKTTISREIFRTQAERYDVCYFLPDFHIVCQTRGLSHLRDEFFSKICGEEKVIVDVYDTKLGFIRDRFLSKKVLIVLDGVSNARDAEFLVGGFGWLSGGHTLILTSRNRQVLVQCNAKEICEIQKLSEHQSLHLFSQFSTGQNWKERTSLVSELVNYASGIPLALCALGSSLQNQRINGEKQHLKRLRQHPLVEIQDAFKISFNVLDDNEKNTFLDLACFFRGENKDYVVNILDGCGFLTDLGIYGLIDKSLISHVGNRIEMPNIFQDTGRFVVCQESNETGKRSRLWDPTDIVDVLTKDSGTEATEGIFLDASGLTFELSPTAFENMYSLRLLKLCSPTSENHCNVCLPQGLYSLPDELRLLHWERYPLGSLPRNFNPKNIVELNMPYSNMTKLWKGTKNLANLKRIILSHSRQLIKFPRLSKAKNLEHIDLEGCTSLVKVNSSILHHQKLTFLSLKDCSRLRSMPATVHLEVLEVLNLSGCSELEDLQDFSPNLSELYLAGTAITKMPSSIGGLTRLVTLDLENCNRLQHLPPEISNLKAVVSLSAKHRALSNDSRDLSSFEDVGQPCKKYRLKKVIHAVIMILRLWKPVKRASIATNLSEVKLGSVSTSLSDISSNSFLGFFGLPERPGQPECPYYMKTGVCRFGSDCKFHHPKDGETHVTDSSLSSLSHPSRPVELGSVFTSLSDISSNPFLGFFGLPERPGQPECAYYMKTGVCTLGSDCKFHHPRDRETHVTDSSLSSLSHPSRPGKPVCASYYYTGNCSSGATCMFDHPSLRPTHRDTSSVASLAPYLNQRGFSSSIGDSSSKLVEAATKKQRIHHNTSSMDSVTPHSSPLGISSSLGDSSSEPVETMANLLMLLSRHSN